MSELNDRRIRVLKTSKCGSIGQSKVPILSWETKKHALVHMSSEVPLVHGFVSFMGSSPLLQLTVLIDSPERLKLGHQAESV